MGRHPEQLRSVVLDSPWPPEASWIAALPMPVSRELRQMLALCAAEPSPAGARSAAAPAFGPLRSRR